MNCEWIDDGDRRFVVLYLPSTKWQNENHSIYKNINIIDEQACDLPPRICVVEICFVERGAFSSETSK